MSAGLFKSPDILSNDPKKLYMNTASVPVYFQYRNVHFWHYRLNHGNFAMHFSLCPQDVSHQASPRPRQSSG